MINPFLIKKYGALLLSSLLTVIFFAVGTIYYTFYIGIALMFIGLLLGVFAANMMLKTPFTDMLEGKGLLAMDLNSTGVITFFLVGLHRPFIKGQVHNQEVKDIFDRNSIAYIKPPMKASKPVEYKDGKIVLTLSEGEYNNAKFALYQWPVILYNSQIQSVITKDFFDKEEKTIFAEHSIIYLNRIVQELTSLVRDFGRHVIESLKPKLSMFKNKWFMFVVILFIAIVVIIFLPKIINTFGGSLSTAGSTITDTIQQPIQAVP